MRNHNNQIEKPLKRLRFILVTALCAAAFFGNGSWQASEREDVVHGMTGLSDYWNRKVSERKPSDGDETETSGTEAEPEKQYNTTPQLTEDDIFEMNHGVATMLYTDGYLTFLRGKYYEGKVTNEEEGIVSLYGVANLLGLSKGSEFFGLFRESNSYGYTCYAYQQRYGDLTLENAVLKIIVDPDGYTAGLISSFTPNVGFAPTEESSITPQEAEEVVRTRYQQETFTFFPEYTRQTSVTIRGVAYHAWAIFTDYPENNYSGEGRAYLEHLVAYDGSYLMYTAVSSPEELVLGDNAQAALALSWFDGMEEDTYTGTVTLHDGSQKEITVPVVRDAEGTYYLADAGRHILLADHHAYVYEGHTCKPWTSKDNTGWPEHYLLTYEAYIKVYDFFESYGLSSIDGFGMPLLILTDYGDALQNPINNACFLGIEAGWGLFAASSLNDFGECIDVIAHEFTHGITTYSLAGDLYENESGAVNEALSDIVGNLCEMLLGETDDTQWLLGEIGGWTVRSMSFPWEYGQPVKIDGRYYQDTTDEPSLDNDFGGVHTNSSLVNYIAWELCKEGMSLDDAFRLWMDTIKLLTPYSGFREVHHALAFAAEMRQMDVKWIGRIDMLCEAAGY